MKQLFIILFVTLMSCNEAKESKAINSNSETIDIEHKASEKPEVEFNLLNTVLKNLNIKKENCKLNLIAQKENPTNPEETIFAIPEIANNDTQDDTYFKYNSYIAIANTNTGDIKQAYSESAKTSDWTSDAVVLSDIEIDSVLYQISGKEHAFGIRVSYHNNSQPNPYSNETLSLFVKSGNTLKKILNNYEVMNSGGETDTVCYRDFISHHKELMMSRGHTNSYFNILVKNTITETKSHQDKNDECIDTDIITTEASTLAFNNNEYKKSKKQDLILTTIDSVSIVEIKKYSNPKSSIFEYYKMETEDEVDIWSDKLFGRCCTEADLSYSELLDFKIDATIKNDLYPDNNLSDKTYRTAFVFKENDNPKITLRLLKVSENHSYHTSLQVDDVLKPNDTILKPFRLSLVNGYVKSEALFKKNGRIKTMEIYKNKDYKGTILLKDTPLIQEFYVDFSFFKNDVVTLILQSYYKGTKYDDICISEIQSSLANITHPSLNKKYQIQALRKN